MPYKIIRNPYVEKVFYNKQEAEIFAKSKKPELRFIQEMNVADWRKPK